MQLNLRNAVLISNSMPKSGSTFLFNLQQSLILKISGTDTRYVRELLPRKGIKSNADFVHNPLQPEFIELITNADLNDGPYLFKTHCIISGALKKAFLSSDNIFISCCARDPVEIFLSATDNYNKTGEFNDFSTLANGCSIINDYFSKIVTSCKDVSSMKVIPIVKYEDIVSNPIDALIDSLHPALQRLILGKAVSSLVDTSEASSAAINRMNKGVLNRAASYADQGLIKHLERQLEFSRIATGYK